MTYGGGAAAAVAAYAAIAQAVKASGAIISLDPDNFMKMVVKTEKPLVVMAPGGWLNKGYQYLTAYKGLIFYTKSNSQLMLPGGVELIAARQIWIPG